MSAISHYPQYVYSNLTAAADPRYITRSNPASSFPGSSNPFASFQTGQASDLYSFTHQPVTSVVEKDAEQKTNWVARFVAAGASIAALIYLCKRFDVGNMINTVLAPLKDLPVFSRVMEALSSMSAKQTPKQAGANATNLPFGQNQPKTQANSKLAATA